MIDFISMAQAATEAAQHVVESGAAAESTSEGILGKLGIDLQLFIAQLINFAIVLFVLWKWVFTPVTKKLQERADKIEKSLHDADVVEKEKQEFSQWREQEIAKTRSSAQHIVAEAQQEAQNIKQATLEQTGQEQQKLVEQAKKEIHHEKQQVLSSAKAEIADMVTTASEKILREKLDEKKDKGLIEKTLDNLN